MSHTIIGLEQLEKLAGSKVYALALERQVQQNIEAFVLNQHSAEATVDGYKVQLQYRGESVEGACDCPESDGFEFCQHCVQLAIHCNRATQQMLSLSKGPDKSKVMAYLLSLDKAELAKHTLALLEADASAFKRYLLKASLVQEHLDLAALRTELTDLTRAQKGLFSQRQLKHFFGRIERFFEELGSADCRGQEEALLKLIEYALQRINKLLGQMEDRTGQRNLAVSLLRSLYALYFSKVQGRTETRAKRFAKSWRVDRYGLLGAPEPYFEKEPEAYSALVQLIRADWQKIVEDSASGADAWQVDRIARFLLECDQAELADRQKRMMQCQLAKSEDDKTLLIATWLSQDLIEDAATLMPEMLRQYPDSLAVHQAAFEVWTRQAENIALLFPGFVRFPLALGPRLLEYAEQQGSDMVALRERMITELTDAVSAEEQYLRVQLLLDNSRYPEALEAMYRVNLRPEQCAEVAKRLASWSPARSGELIKELIPTLLNRNMASADKKAAELMWFLEQMTSDCEGLDDYVTKHQRQFRASPRFMERLQVLSDKPEGLS